jgi:hypothetical protein
MSIPIDKNPEKGQNLGDKPLDSLNLPKNTPAPKFSIENKDIIESTRSHGILGKSMQLVSDKPVLTKVDSLLEGNFYQNNADRSSGPGGIFSPETQKLIKAYLNKVQADNSEVMEIKDFYQVLAKVFPIATSFLGQLDGKEVPFEKFKENLNQVVIQTQTQIKNNPELIHFPQAIKEMMATMDFSNPESFQVLAQAINENASQTNAEPSQKNQDETLMAMNEPNSENTTPNIATDGSAKVTEGKGLFEYFSSVVKTLSLVEAFPSEHKSEVLLLSMGSLTINSQGLMGENMTQLKGGLTDLTMNFATKLDLVPDDKVAIGKNYLSNVFDHFILGGILLGKSLSLKAGKSIDLDSNSQLLQLSLDKRPETKIFDQIPFSFMAFFVPFVDLKEHSSKALKDAKQALINLIRLMLRLVFMLLAVQSSGVTLGKEGMDVILKINSDYFVSTLNDLIFALKKINELYGVKVKIQLEGAERARKALLDGKNEDFWESALGIFMENTDLSAFMKETKDSDSLFGAIHTLVNPKSTEDATIHLQTQG